MLTFRFDLEKTLRASSMIVEAHDGRIDRMRLLKLLYIADREMILSRGTPVTGDTAHALKLGPVPSKTYDLIKGQGLQSVRWAEHFRNDGYLVYLRKPYPDAGVLSPADVQKLTDVCDRYHGTDTLELSELTHDFPEWVRAFRPEAGIRSAPIDWADVLTDAGRADAIDDIRRDELYMKSVDALFESAV